MKKEINKIEVFEQDKKDYSENFYPKDLYINPLVKKYFEETGGWNHLSFQELAELSQRVESAEGRTTFKEITGMDIDSEEKIKELFQSIVNKEIDLTEALKDQKLIKFIKSENEGDKKKGEKCRIVWKKKINPEEKDFTNWKINTTGQDKQPLVDYVKQLNDENPDYTYELEVKEINDMDEVRRSEAEARDLPIDSTTWKQMLKVDKSQHRD